MCIIVHEWLVQTLDALSSKSQSFVFQIQDTLSKINPQGMHCSSTVNIHVRAQKGYYLEQACTKCTYKRHIAIKQEVDKYEVGDTAIEKYM